MTSQADAAIEPASTPATAPAALSPLRVFYWSVRRELWEHGSVWIAPLAVATVALLGFLLGAVSLAHVMRAGATFNGDATKIIAVPYEFVAAAVFLTGFLVAVFYCLGALHNERRDRSILYWKSLPVSDLTSVLAKATVPLIVIPPILFVVIVGAQLIVLALSTLIALATGLDPNVLWAHTPILDIWLDLARGLPILALWYAPLYGWLLLVSAWARRAPFLWAVVPPLALALLERLALGTSYVGSWLRLRLIGPFAASMAHAKAPLGHATALDPTGWTSPHLWIGIVLAAAFLALAVRLRRSSDPI